MEKSKGGGHPCSFFAPSQANTMSSILHLMVYNPYIARRVARLHTIEEIARDIYVHALARLPGLPDDDKLDLLARHCLRAAEVLEKAILHHRGVDEFRGK